MGAAGTYLPYQDPTPEMLREHAEAVARADLMNLRAMAAGALLTLTGTALLACTAVQRRRVQRTRDGSPLAESGSPPDSIVNDS